MLGNIGNAAVFYIQWKQGCQTQTNQQQPLQQQKHKKYQGCAQLEYLADFQLMCWIFNWIGHTTQEDELKCQEVECTKDKWTLGNAVFRNFSILNIYH